MNSVGCGNSSSSMSSSDWRLRLRLWAHVYGKFSNSISYDHQLILRHVLALDYGLQVQQRLQSCLFTSIKWILCKFRLLRNDQMLDIIFQLVYAYAWLRGAIDFPPRRLLVGRVLANRRSRLRCCTMRNRILALETSLAAGRDETESEGNAYVDGVHRIRLLGQRRTRVLLSVGSGKRRLPLRRRLIWSGGRRSGCVTAGNGCPATEELLLALVACLVGGKGGIPRSHQGVLNWPDLLEREDRLCRDRAGHRFFPCLEHLVHLPSCAIVDLGVSAHEERIELRAEVQRIGGRHVLDDRI